MPIEIFWFLAVALMLTTYVVLDGFDLGAGALHLFLARGDEERRKIERNLHDGVQQQLVALNVQLGLLAKVAEREPTKAGEMATGLQTRATEALEDLRDLARGIYPPLLADKGLPAALEACRRWICPRRRTEKPVCPTSSPLSSVVIAMISPSINHSSALSR